VGSFTVQPMPGRNPDNELVLLRATVRKLRAERKLMHEMLSEAGVPDDVLGDDVRTCLIGRLAIAIGTGPVSNSLECTCPRAYQPDGPVLHQPGCVVWK
jgi:hypothetical protein